MYPPQESTSSLWDDPIIREFLKPRKETRKRTRTLAPEPRRERQDVKRNYRKKVMREDPCVQIGLLAGLAFLNSGRNGASLREIYAFVSEHFVDFENKLSACEVAWKKSVRHSLCTFTDCYIKAEGDGNWEFSNKDAFMFRLHAFVQRNPMVLTYGLKNPIDWDRMVAGKLGLPTPPPKAQRGTKIGYRRSHRLDDSTTASPPKRRRAAPKTIPDGYAPTTEAEDGARAQWNWSPLPEAGFSPKSEPTSPVYFNYDALPEAWIHPGPMPYFYGQQYMNYMTPQMAYTPTPMCEPVSYHPTQMYEPVSYHPMPMCEPVAPFYAPQETPSPPTFSPDLCDDVTSLQLIPQDLCDEILESVAPFFTSTSLPVLSPDICDDFFSFL